MLLDKLLAAVFQFREFKSRHDDDSIDRLSRQYTPALLVLITIVISVKTYIGAPIDCWCPAQFTESHIEYANAICWVNNTYFVPFEEPMPLHGQKRRVIAYYQWVPFILLTQATFFFSPCLFWRVFSRRAGLNVLGVVETAHAAQKAQYSEAREQGLRYVVMQLDSYLRRHKRPDSETCCSRAKQYLAKNCCLFWARFYGNHLWCAYLVVKLLYLSNALGQLILLDVFLGMGREYLVFGLTVLRKVSEGQEWAISERFPRVTLCDFEIRQQTNVHRYTVQCVLPINLFNEKIFVFVWFWLLMVAGATTVSIFQWITRSAILSTQTVYVQRQLRAADQEKRDARIVRRFTDGYLRRDGLLVVHLIAVNVGDLVAAEVLHGLWHNSGTDKRGLMIGDNDPVLTNGGQQRLRARKKVRLFCS